MEYVNYPSKTIVKGRTLAKTRSTALVGLALPNLTFLIKSTEQRKCNPPRDIMRFIVRDRLMWPKIRRHDHVNGIM